MQGKEQKISPIKQRILQYADTLGISKREFYKKIGVSRGTLESKTGITEDVLAKFIATYPEVSIDWLMKGTAEKTNVIDSEAHSKEREIPLPLIPSEAFAGYGAVVYGDLPIEDYYTVNEFRDADFLIRVKGDSMSPKFNGGDIVACRKIKEMVFFHWNRIYVIYTESQGMLIKRVMPSDDDSSITLVSDNKAYQPFNVPKSEISAIALVLGAIILE